MHLTAGNGNAAKACLNLRRGYFGVCMTQKHMDALWEELIAWMLTEFADTNSVHYQSKYSGLGLPLGAVTQYCVNVF